MCHRHRYRPATQAQKNLTRVSGKTANMASIFGTRTERRRTAAARAVAASGLDEKDIEKGCTLSTLLTEQRTRTAKERHLATRVDHVRDELKALKAYGRLGRAKARLGEANALTSDDVLDDVAADAYGLLNGVLESLDDHYVHRQPGLQRTIEEVDGLLRRVDADLHKHLDEVGVLLLQVTFRWINCLLVRELPMRCAIRLWDTCLAEERGFRTFFPYVCAAFLCHFSDALKAKPTEDVHLFLTSLPTSNWADDEVETLLSEAYILSTLFRSAPAHLQHEPDGITPCGGFL